MQKVRKFKGEEYRAASVSDELALVDVDAVALPLEGSRSLLGTPELRHYRRIEPVRVRMRGMSYGVGVSDLEFGT